MKIDKNLNEEIKVNDTLNPKLWNEDDELRDDVKERLLDIADSFLDDLKEDGLTLDVVDIRLLGSSANYNYTDMSDIDLHIVADLGTTDDIKIMQLLCNAYKSLFNSKYEIKVKGREVELYVEDVNQPAKSNGVYSLYTGWIKKPVRTEIPEIDYDELEKQFDEWEDRYFDIVGEHTSLDEELVYHGQDSDKLINSKDRLTWFTPNKKYAQEYGNKVFSKDIDFSKCELLDVGYIGSSIWNVKGKYSKEFLNFCKLIEMTPTQLKQFLSQFGFRLESSNYIYDITSEYPFYVLIQSLGYDGIKADEGGVITYGLVDFDNCVVNEELNEDLSQEVDSEGNPLSNEQVEFFKNSKVRDNQGRLLVCYHSTNKDFDVFKYATFFTPNKQFSLGYGNKIKECYLNLEKPFIIDYDKLWDFVEAHDNGEDYFENELDIVNEFGINTPDLYFTLLGAYDFSNDTSYYDVIDAVQGEGDYDGIILYNSMMNAGIDTQIITFYPNQIKLIDNKNPSNSNNINESKLLEIYPKDNETKKDFISRFMSATEKEYPNQKQRLAVAYSYWDKKESLTEMVKFDEDAFDVYMFESPYQVKNFLLSKTEPQRLYIEGNLYLVANAYDCVHTDMKNAAYQNGYLSTDLVNDFDKNQVCAIYCPDSYHTNEFEIYDVVGDDYNFKYKTDDGYIYSRYQDIKNFKLFDVLGGNPKRLEFIENFRTKLKESDDFDYGTGDVNGSDIFDTSTTGTTGSWKDLLLGNDVDYYKNKKNLVGEIVQMSPQEYYEACADMFSSKKHKKVTANDLKQQREYDKKTLDYLKTVITDKKKKFPIAVLDLSYYPGQEGLHRMMVAGDLFGWDTKFPVLVIKTYDQEKQKRIERNYAQNKFNDNVEKAIRYLDGWEFYDYDEFYDELMRKLEDYIGSSDIILSTEGNTLEISMYNDDIDDTLIYNYDLNNVKIIKDEDDDEIEEIDVDDYLDLDDLTDDDIILDKDLK